MAAGTTSGSGLMLKSAALKPHLAQPGSTGGVSAEVADLRTDVQKAFSAVAALAVDEFTDGAAAVANAIKLAIASSVAPVTYSGAQLDGAVGAAKMPIPRNITVTTAGGTAADAPATATINGSFRGKAQTDTITVAQTATIATGTKPFDLVTSIVLPAAEGAGATLAFGFGAAFGLSKTPKARAGLATPVQEVAAGALVTNGVITVSSLYTPNTVPNGTNDYAVFYEFDATV